MKLLQLPSPGREKNVIKESHSIMITLLTKALNCFRRDKLNIINNKNWLTSAA